MTLGFLALLSVLLAPLLLGAGILRCIGLRVRDDPLGFLAWSALAGGLGTGVLLFLWSWLELPYRASLLAPLVAGLGLVSLFVGARRPAEVRTPPAAASRAYPWFERLAFALVLVVVCEATGVRVLRAATAAPMMGDDASIWTIKARLLYDVGGLNAEYRARTLPYFESHPDYPLLNPLLQLWAFAHSGELQMVEARFPIQVFAFALVLAWASALRRVLRPGAAAALVLVLYALSSSAELVHLALADQMVALGLLVAVDAGLRWLQGGGAAWARLCALALAFLACSKNEGVLYVFAFLSAGALCWRWPGRARPSARTLVWLALPLVTIAAGVWTDAHFGFANDHARAGAVGVLVERGPERLAPLLAYFARLFFLRPGENSGLYGELLVLSALVPLRLLRARLRLPTLLLWMLLPGWALIYLCTPHDLTWHLVSSAPRLTYHALAVVALVLALYLAGDPRFGPALRARRRA